MCPVCVCTLSIDVFFFFLLRLLPKVHRVGCECTVPLFGWADAFDMRPPGQLCMRGQTSDNASE